jgi:16S rRNA pseudouridine516 synthase
MLRGETTPLQPATMRAVDDQTAEITIFEGRYHQLRRMFAAVGNHVTALHRLQLGPLALGHLPVATWRILDPNEVASLAAPP